MKKLLIAFLVLFVHSAVYSQNEDISTLVISMPDNFLIGMDAEQKAELVASPDSVNISVETKIGGDIERTAMTKDYIRFNTSEVGTLEVKLLPLVNDTYIVAVITSVCGSACDSRIDFYTTSWTPLSADELFPAKDVNWFLDVKSDADPNVSNNLSAILDMNPIKLSFVPDSTDVKAEYDIQKYLSSEDYKSISSALVKDPFVFKWDKSSYKR